MGLEGSQQVWKVHAWKGPQPISKAANPLPSPFPLGSPAFLFPAVAFIEKEGGLLWPLKLRSQSATETICQPPKGSRFSGLKITGEETKAPAGGAACGHSDQRTSSAIWNQPAQSWVSRERLSEEEGF